MDNDHFSQHISIISFIFIRVILITTCVPRRKTLQIARQLGDRALEAQACYSLGNTYTLLRDYERAIDYHMQHLQIARALRDRVGEGRACWSLGNAHTAVGNHEDARQFAVQHLEISKEVSAPSCLNHRFHICLNLWKSASSEFSYFFAQI